METLEKKGTKTLKMQLTDASEFTNFLKRFSPISGSLLIEIEDNYLKAKTHTPERSVVKSSKIELSRVFNIESVDEPIIFGVYSVDKLINSFSHFNGTELTFTIKLENTPSFDEVYIFSKRGIEYTPTQLYNKLSNNDTSTITRT
jgi:hypothetical protein